MTRTTSFSRQHLTDAPQSTTTTTAIPPPGTTLDDVRRQAHELASDDALDKTAALSVMHLFHAMETILRYECTSRDRRIDELSAELERHHLESALREEELANANVNSSLPPGPALSSTAPDPGVFMPTPSSTAAKKRSRW